MNTTYCLGLAFTPTGELVVVKKNRPQWQSGLLNAPGGHVEEGETPLESMIREFEEETNILAQAWEQIFTVQFPSAELHVFTTNLSPAQLSDLRSVTDELITVVSPTSIIDRTLPCVGNLPWMVAFAANETGNYEPFTLISK